MFCHEQWSIIIIQKVVDYSMLQLTNQNQAEGSQLFSFVGNKLLRLNEI